MKIILILAAVVLCQQFYRMGGSGDYPRQVRIVGVPFIMTLLAFCFGCHDPIALGLSFLLTMAAISTYWDFLFGYDNFWFHGFMIGISAAPIAYTMGSWFWFTMRCFILAIFMGIWCALWTWDEAEERGRGAIIPATFWLL